MDGLRSDTVKAQKTADHATEAIHTLESTVDSLRSELSLVDESVDGKIENKLSTLTQTIDSLESKLNQISRDVDGNIDAKLSQVTQTVNGLSSIVTSLQKTVDGFDYVTQSKLTQTADSLRFEISEAKNTANSVNRQISTLTQTVNGLDSKINQLSRDTDGNVDAKVSQLTQTVNGLSSNVANLQRTVDGLDYVTQSKLTQTADSLRSEISEAQSTANGANRQISTLTQTVNGLQSKVNQLSIGAGGNVDAQLSQITQTVNSLSSSVTNLQRTVNGLDYVTQSKLTQTANSLRSEISEAQSTANAANKQVSTLTQTAQGLQVSVRDLQRNQESQITQLNNLIRTQVTQSDVRSLISQSERDILMQVQGSDLNGQEIISRINLSPGTVRISGNKIQIDGNTYIANATIKNSHIASLSADKITAGTLDAAKVRVINLNAQNISGFNSSFVQSLWNGINNSVRIDSSGVWSNASDQSQVFMMDGRLNVRNPNGATIGSVGYWYSGGSPRFTIRTTLGAHFSLLQRDSRGRDFETIYAGNGGAEYYNRADRVYFEGSRADIRGDLYILNAKTLRLSDGNITDAYGIYFNHGGGMWTLSGGEATRVNGVRQLQLQVNGTKKMTIDTTRIYMYQDLNMQYHSIVQQSDARFKTNVQDYDYDALSRVDQIKFKTFNWKSSGKRDYGFIAQEVQEFAPEWINEEPDGSLTYDTLLIAKIALRSAQQLSQKIKELENEIKTLSGNEP